MTRQDESLRMRTEAVLAEHRALLAIVARLRAAAGLDELRARLAEFRDAAVAHFDGEETEDGFFDRVLEAAPRHQAVVEDLRDEHERMLRDASRLAAALDACGADGWQGLRAQLAELLDRLEDHEAREHEILLDVMDTDLGTGD